MAMATFKCEFPKRQAMLAVYEERKPVQPWQDITAVINYMQGRKVVDRVPVFVWPMPMQSGYFIVEHRDGRCTFAYPDDLTFLDSKELFDKYDWSENA